jgi:LysM repeat protein
LRFDRFFDKKKRKKKKRKTKKRNKTKAYYRSRFIMLLIVCSLVLLLSFVEVEAGQANDMFLASQVLFSAVDRIDARKKDRQQQRALNTANARIHKLERAQEAKEREQEEARKLEEEKARKIAKAKKHAEYVAYQKRKAMEKAAEEARKKKEEHQRVEKELKLLKADRDSRTYRVKAGDTLSKLAKTRKSLHHMHLALYNRLKTTNLKAEQKLVFPKEAEALKEYKWFAKQCSKSTFEDCKQKRSAFVKAQLQKQKEERVKAQIERERKNEEEINDVLRALESGQDLSDTGLYSN